MQLPILVTVSLFSVALASPTRTFSLGRRNNTSDACAIVSSSSAVQVAATPSATPYVDGKLALECLQSVPINQEDALELMDTIIPYVQYQTDLTYLKNPPSSYLEPAVDIKADLNKIIANIQNGTYAGEYEFQADLFRVFNEAHDGHFRFYPDLLTGAIAFRRGITVVSVSSDGYELPQIYVLSDLEKSGKHFTPSYITKVNGQDAVAFIENLSQLGVLQDPDALYNTMFFSPAFNALDVGEWFGYFGSSGRFGYIWPGESTTLTFHNGTKVTVDTKAAVIGDFTGVTDGESAYEVFCSGANSVTGRNASGSAQANVNTSPSAPTVLPDTTIAVAGVAAVTGTPIPSTTSTAASTVYSLYGYPTPVVAASDGSAAGFYVNNTDVAVLVMTSFEPETPAEFQAVVQTFIEEAKASGKKKLVVDVSGNGGGYILQGYDTFRQLFPQIDQYGYTRFRNSESFQLIAQEATRGIPENFSPYTSDSEILIEAWESPFNYRYDYNFTNQPFEDYEAKFAIQEFNGDNYTQIMRWNLNDNLTTTNTTFGMGMEITGYGSRANFTQPFPAEDVILLYDGYCASTCTLFSEFLRIQAGVKSIVFGGRPKNGPQQGIGGIKGANNFAFDYIADMSELAYVAETAAEKNWANSSVLLQTSNRLPINRSTGTSLNVRDNILPDNLDDGLPAQFVYEAADCRLFYTAENVLDVSTAWADAADAAWYGKKCVYGGFPHAKREPHSRPTEREAARGMKRGITVPQGPALTKSSNWAALHGEKVPA